LASSRAACSDGDVLERLFAKLGAVDDGDDSRKKPPVTFIVQSSWRFAQARRHAVADFEDHDQVATITLDPVLDLKATTPLAESFLACRGTDLAVDAGQVERLGAQSLQVILSAITTWQADGHTIEFKQPSDAFVDGLHLFGFDAEQILKPQRTA
jgi:chemotaxis protein CheX